MDHSLIAPGECDKGILTKQLQLNLDLPRLQTHPWFDSDVNLQICSSGTINLVSLHKHVLCEAFYIHVVVRA